MESHPYVQLGIWAVRNLEDDRSSQKIKCHGGDLRDVPVTLKKIGRVRFKEDGRKGMLTVSLWHSRHDHELILHSVHIVNLKGTNW